jgi:hypothetical protein
MAGLGAGFSKLSHCENILDFLNWFPVGIIRDEKHIQTKPAVGVIALLCRKSRLK